MGGPVSVTSLWNPFQFHWPCFCSVAVTHSSRHRINYCACNFSNAAFLSRLTHSHSSHASLQSLPQGPQDPQDTIPEHTSRRLQCARLCGVQPARLYQVWRQNTSIQTHKVGPAGNIWTLAQLPAQTGVPSRLLLVISPHKNVCVSSKCISDKGCNLICHVFPYCSSR